MSDQDKPTPMGVVNQSRIKGLRMAYPRRYTLCFSETVKIKDHFTLSRERMADPYFDRAVAYVLEEKE